MERNLRARALSETRGFVKASGAWSDRHDLVDSLSLCGVEPFPRGPVNCPADWWQANFMSN